MSRSRLAASAAAAVLALVISACGSTIETEAGDPIEQALVVPGLVSVTDPATGAVVPGSVPGAPLPEGADSLTPSSEQVPGAGTDLPALGADPSADLPGTSPTDAPSSSTTATTPPKPGQAVTEPISVGFLTTSVSNAAAFGVDAGNQLSGEDIIRGLAAGMNAEGGVAGREIEPVVAKTDTGSASWESDFQAACSKFTEDNQVASVVGYNFVYLDSFETCLTQAGVSHLSTGYDPGDATGFQQYPYISSIYPTFDEKLRLSVRGPYNDGSLTKSNKIGLIVDECPAHVRAQQREIYPFIREKGLTVAATMSVACPRGSGATASGVSQVSNAVLSFRSRGVDRIILDGVTLYFFASAAEAQGYRPVYLTNGGAGLLDNNPLPEAQMKNIRSYGLDPSRDISAKKQGPRTPVQERCLALLKKGGVVARAAADVNAAYSTCDGLFLLEAALKRTNGDSSAPAVTAAIQQLGGSFASTEMIQGRTSFASGDRSGAVMYNVATYDASCKCFGYTTAPKKLP